MSVLRVRPPQALDGAAALLIDLLCQDSDNEGRGPTTYVVVELPFVIGLGTGSLTQRMSPFCTTCAVCVHIRVCSETRESGQPAWPRQRSVPSSLGTPYFSLFDDASVDRLELPLSLEPIG